MAFDVGGWRISGEDDFEFRETRSGKLGELRAGDVEVADEHLDGLRFERAERFFERRGDAGVEPAGERRRGQLHGKRIRDGAVLVHNKKNGSHQSLGGMDAGAAGAAGLGFAAAAGNAPGRSGGNGKRSKIAAVSSGVNWCSRVQNARPMPAS